MILCRMIALSISDFSHDDSVNYSVFHYFHKYNIKKVMAKMR